MFDFLLQPAGFDIGETGGWLFEASQPLWRAFAMGLSNTLRVALPALLLALALGTLWGLMRLSPDPLPRRIATVCIETLRNVPLLVQLLLWYFLLIDGLPAADQALALGPGLWLSKGGLSFPWLEQGQWVWPVQGGFNIQGGGTLTPEYLAVFLALSLYTAAYVAEVVRAGVLSVPGSTLEAAESLGATAWQVRTRVLAPQAWMAMRPALVNQAINLVKNSSLAVAVGYPDLVSVGNTALNQTGRVFECIAVMMGCYLLLSLGLSWLFSRWQVRDHDDAATSAASIKGGAA